MGKRLLIIKAATDICAAEINQLEAIAFMFGICTDTVDCKDLNTLGNDIRCNGNRYDYIYLAAHASPDFFGESDGSNSIAWRELGSAFCYLGCLSPGVILMLGCCRGGLRNVALDLFCSCGQIDYICGPRWTVSAADITAGFHVFMYNMIVRREQPSTAVKRASKATGYDFFCHDRVELQKEIQEYCETDDESSYGSSSGATTTSSYFR